MQSLDIVALTRNDDWETAYQKINHNFTRTQVPGTTSSSEATIIINEVTAAVMKNIYDTMFPVGRIISTSTQNDPILSRGTWVQIFQGRFPIGADNDHPANQTGGSWTKTLAVDNLPQHAHSDNEVTAQSAKSTTLPQGTADTVVTGVTVTSQTTGTTPDAPPTPLDITPPWEACYWYRRTA